MSDMSNGVMVAAGQFEPRQGDMRWNISRVLELASQAGVKGADLVVLPELATTGYYMFNKFHDLAEPLDGPTVAVVHELAKRYDYHVVMGLAEKGDDGKVHDSSVLIGPSGLQGVYRKIHLWDTENSVFTPGDQVMAPETGGPLGRVGLLVCYDLEFPETAERVGALGASLLAATAAFTNLTLWQATLKARARDLGVPVVAANRIGHEMDTDFCGHSSIVAPDGTVLAEAGDEPGLVMAEVVVDPTGKGRPTKDSRLIHPEFG
ncbi:MAG: carbon-nitrogen hydrolase family protein [Thermoplasmata archaeon]|nr:MAG: carbon-nitrogen hydrolase family protein [Thermoplasmata archaeon]